MNVMSPPMSYWPNPLLSNHVIPNTRVGAHIQLMWLAMLLYFLIANDYEKKNYNL